MGSCGSGIDLLRVEGRRRKASSSRLRITSLTPAEDWGSVEEFSLLVASSSCSLWGGTASAAPSVLVLQAAAEPAPAWSA